MISIVCVVRNDQYGINQYERTIGFLKSINEITNKKNYQIIFVEWNPLKENESFYEKYLDYLPNDVNFKIVTVSTKAHESIYNPLNLPLFEYYGKNVGARHSDGSFLIFTNPDNIFFPQTWEDIERNVSDDHFLRLCRSDVRLANLDIIHETSGYQTINELMKSCFHFYEPPAHPNKDINFFENLTEGFYWDINHEGASGDFFGISKFNFEKIKGYCEYWTYGVYDGLICRDSRKLGLKQFILPKFSIHIDHSRPHLGAKKGTEYTIQNNNSDDWGLYKKDGISVVEFF